MSFNKFLFKRSIFLALILSCTYVIPSHALKESDVVADDTSVACYGPPQKSEEELRASYDAFVEKLDTMKIAREYPGAIKNLLRGDSDKQALGLRTLAASREIEVIPWIVPFLDVPTTRLEAGFCLQEIVSAVTLKERRDISEQKKVALKPLTSKDTNFSPLAWVVYRMLQQHDDVNTQAYAATMIGYIELSDFEPELQELLTSKYSVLTDKAVYALKLLKIDPNLPSQSR